MLGGLTLVKGKCSAPFGGGADVRRSKGEAVVFLPAFALTCCCSCDCGDSASLAWGLEPTALQNPSGLQHQMGTVEEASLMDGATAKFSDSAVCKEACWTIQCIM